MLRAARAAARGGPSRPGRRAARHPGRGRRLGQVALRAPGPVHDGRGLLRPEAAGRAGGRPGHGPRARGGAPPGRGRPHALLHQALAGGAGPLPVGALPVLPPEMILLPDRAPPLALPLRVLGTGDLRGADDRALATAHLPPAGRPRGALHGPRRARAPPALPRRPGPGRRSSPGRWAWRAATTAGRSGRCAGWRRRAWRAGSATARRPTARGGASSRRGSTRSSRCTRWGGRSTTRSSRGRWPASTTRSRCATATASASRRACRRCGTPAWPRWRSPTPAPRPTTRPCARPATGCCRRRSPGTATGTTSRAAGGRGAGRSSSPTSGTPTPTTPPRC